MTEDSSVAQAIPSSDSQLTDLKVAIDGVSIQSFHLRCTHRSNRLLHRPTPEGKSVSTLRALLIAAALSLGLAATAVAKINCSDVKNKNQDECVRAKVNSSNDINCSDVKNKNRDECIRVKANKSGGNLDDVNCSNAKDADVRQACRRAK
jgi:hypothetical protein